MEKSRVFMMGVPRTIKPLCRFLRFATFAAVVGTTLASRDARAAGASVADATDAQKDKAKDKYQAGMQAFDQQKYDQALALFRDSYDIVASPNSHLMIARALARLDRLPEAYREYELTAIEADRAGERGKYRPTARTARSERAELESRLAFITPRVNASVSVGGVDIPPEQLGKPFPVKPGNVEVVLRTPSGGETHQQVTAEPGKKTDVPLEPMAPAEGGAVASAPAPCVEKGSAPPPVSGINQTTLGFIFGGVGLAGGATFAVFGLLNNNKYDELQNECTDNICSSDLANEGETGRRYQTIANVGLGVGVVGLATGVILLLTAPSSSHGKEMSHEDHWPEVAVAPRSVTVRGRF